MGLRIRPIKLAETVLDHKAKFTYFRGWEEKISIVYVAWYLTDGKTNILVDTGVGDPAWALTNRGLKLVQSPENTMPAWLERLGLSPGQIDLIICTHLHWDHCQNHGLFPGTEFLVQKRELEHAIHPLPTDRSTYGWSPDQAAPFLQVASRYRVLEGDKKVYPGVSVVFTPGHTPGLQGVFVEGDRASYFLASDTLPLFENWVGDEPVPSGIYVNMEDYYNSFDKIRSLGADRVFPGHDPRVMDQPEYH